MHAAVTHHYKLVVDCLLIRRHIAKVKLSGDIMSSDILAAALWVASHAGLLRRRLTIFFLIYILMVLCFARNPGGYKVKIKRTTSLNINQHRVLIHLSRMLSVNY